MRIRARFVAPLLVAFVIGIGSLSGCSTSSNTAAAPPPADQTCFSQMDPDQKTQLQQYVAQQGGSVSSTTNANGTQDICVLQPDGSGVMEAHYYTQNDGFSDFFLYAMLAGRSDSLATYGLLSGNLDVSQYLALQLLTGMGSNGSLYHPYTYGSGGWARQTTVINYHVTYVQYGRSKPLSYSTAYKSPPRGYTTSRLPSSNGQQATVSKNSHGAGGITTTKTLPGNNYHNPSQGGAATAKPQCCTPVKTAPASPSAPVIKKPAPVIKTK